MLVPCASAVSEGDVNEVSVSVWHTRRLPTWGKVAGQSTGLGAVFDDAFGAISNARRGAI